MRSTALFRTEAEIDIGRSEWGGPITVDTSLGTVQLRMTGDLQSLERCGRTAGGFALHRCAELRWAQAWERHVLGPRVVSR